MRIDIRGRGPLLSDEEVRTMVLRRYGVREVTDECAATIASWWQAPGHVGYALAQLASTGMVDYDDLADDIYATRKEVVHEDDRAALDMLSTWALSRIRT